MSPKRALMRFLPLAAWLELLRYDLTVSIFGYRSAHENLRTFAVAKQKCEGVEEAVGSAIAWAACFYFRPVRCLQSSVAVVRLLRRLGAPARLVIGCRTAPFTGHAWVEVDSRVVNGPVAYRNRLSVLERL